MGTQGPAVRISEVTERKKTEDIVRQIERRYTIFATLLPGTVIERIFGVLKECFKIMEYSCDYGIKDQPVVVTAICLLFNMIRTFETEDFAIGTIIAPSPDIAAGRVYEQEDFSVLDTDLEGFGQMDAGVRRRDDQGPEALRPPPISRAWERRQRRELKAAQLARAQAI